MKLSDLRYVKIPFTLYDLFGYLLPGVFFFALFPITYDAGTVMDLLARFMSSHSVGNHIQNGFFLLQVVNVVKASPWLITVYFFLVAYLLGHVIAALSGFFLERLAVEKFLKYPAANMFNLRTHEGFIEKIVFAALKHVPAWDTLKDFVFRNYRRPYSPDFINAFNDRFRETFRVDAQNQSDIFWLCFAYVSQNCPSTFQRASHFLNLYGFARNLSMMFFIFVPTMFGFEISRGLQLSGWIFLGYLIIGIGFFWQYLKFFRRLNDEVYRGFVSYVSVAQDRGRMSENDL